MDNKQIEEAVKISEELYEIRAKECGNIPPYALSEEAKALRILLSLAHLFLSVKGAPKKKEVRTETNKRQMKIGSNEIIDVETHIHYDKEAEAYNLCHDEFTAWLAGRMEKLTEVQLPYPATFTLAFPDGKINTITLSHEAATAIKTMIMGEEK